MTTLESAFPGDDDLTQPSPKAPHRRNREELEQLAADFVNSKIHVKRTPARAQVPKPVLAGGGVVAAALLAWLLWPETQTETVRETPAQAAAAEAWAERLAAERERKRRELQSSREYLAKMAASDSALVAELTSRAQALATRAAEPAPAPDRAAEPTPRTETKAASAPARTENPPPAQAASTPAPAPVQQQQAPATTAPVQVAQAKAADCRIHVSELSGSGKLTYADVARMKGATTDERGHVFTPPVAANGRSVVFEVMPTGCVRVARTR